MARILAHTFHEGEQGLAATHIADPEVSTQAYVIGEADEGAIADMEAIGMLVERLPDLGPSSSSPPPTRM